MRVPATVTVTLVLLVAARPAWGACDERVGEVVAVVERVEIALAGAPAETVATGREVCAGATITVSSRGQVAVLLTDGPVVRFTPGTTVRFERAATGGFLVRLLRGIVSLFSRRPHALAVETPFATAAVEGTEFVVALEPALTRVSVLEGRVRVVNPLGSLGVAAGEVAVAARGAAPALELTLRPRDAVRWAIYYPPVGTGPLADERLVAAQEALRAGRPGEAETIITGVLTRDLRDGEALALRSVIALARNDKAAALTTAGQAVAASPAIAAPRIALAYAQQAAFDLEAARATLQEAARVAPGDALIQAQLAEVELALGNRRAARTAAARARELAPGLARTAIVDGFAALAAYDTTTAKARFAAAIASEPFTPLARLGQGLATIRDGDLEAGRRDLELAVAFDPDNALYRSYLGKAYFEERNDVAAAEELATAKALDPNDPTPWLYDAIRKQLENRPVEALRDLERSIELNDNRAVYRSRLALDEDAATRGISLARIYDDLNFIELGRTEAAKSLMTDPTNPAAHRFLADLYRGEPRLEIARASELLQAQLYGPLTPDLMQPSLAFTDLGVVRATLLEPGTSEFTELFQQDGISGRLTTQIGSNTTRAAEALVAAQIDALTFGVGRFHYETDGFRDNNQSDQDITNLFAQAQLTDLLNIQGEYRQRDTHTGDRVLNFDPNEFNPTQKSAIEEEIYRIGARFTFSPDSSLIISGFYVDRDARQDQEISSFFTGESDSRVRPEDDGSQLEALLTTRSSGAVWRIGAGWGRTHGTTDSVRSFADGSTLATGFDDRDLDYDVVFTEVRAPMGPSLQALLRLGYSNVDLGDRAASGLEPALGLIWAPDPSLVLRFAGSRTYRRPLLVSQTVLPTEAAGINLLFDDVDGTRADTLATAAEYRLSSSMRLVASGYRRWLNTEATQVDEDDDTGLAQDDFADDATEDRLSAGLYSTLTPRLSGSAGVVWDRYSRNERDTEEGPQRVETLAVPVALRYFHPRGFYAFAGATWVDQQVVERNFGPQETASDSGALVDIELGYRWPGTKARASLLLANALDRELSFQDESFRTATPLEPRFIPERTLLANISLGF